MKRMSLNNMATHIKRAPRLKTMSWKRRFFFLNVNWVSAISHIIITSWGAYSQGERGFQVTPPSRWRPGQWETPRWNCRCQSLQRMRTFVTNPVRITRTTRKRCLLASLMSPLQFFDIIPILWRPSPVRIWRANVCYIVARLHVFKVYLSKLKSWTS